MAADGAKTTKAAPVMAREQGKNCVMSDGTLKSLHG
jgi:hypothetical protein